jgi:hypothetical protein
MITTGDNSAKQNAHVDRCSNRLSSDGSPMHSLWQDESHMPVRFCS